MSKKKGPSKKRRKLGKDECEDDRDSGGDAESDFEEYNGQYENPEDFSNIPDDGRRKRMAPRRFEPVLALARGPKKKRLHEDYCFLCDDGGELIECSQCPKVYHTDCVGLKKVPKGAFHCSWHSCFRCDRSATNSGGMQFRCLECPLAYCFDCLPADQEVQRLPPPESFVRNFESRGFEIASSSLWYRCTECKEALNSEARKAALAKIEQQKAVLAQRLEGGMTQCV